MKNLTKILLAVLFLVFTITSSCFGADKNPYKEYDKLFNAINKQRHGLTNAQIDKTKNPFILTSKKNVSSPDTNSSAEPVYVLKGIINKSANINGKWYKLNDTINEFKLTKIKDGSVILDNAGNSLELKLNNKGKENVIITIH